tara:strand:+ start:15448 stop:19386 length:3939 start_codon:yes stop_codon:yes gene_type:complete
MLNRKRLNARYFAIFGGGDENEKNEQVFNIDENDAEQDESIKNNINIPKELPGENSIFKHKITTNEEITINSDFYNYNMMFKFPFERHLRIKKKPNSTQDNPSKLKFGLINKYIDTEQNDYKTSLNESDAKYTAVEINSTNDVYIVSKSDLNTVQINTNIKSSDINIIIRIDEDMIVKFKILRTDDNQNILNNSNWYVSDFTVSGLTELSFFANSVGITEYKIVMFPIPNIVNSNFIAPVNLTNNPELLFFNNNTYNFDDPNEIITMTDSHNIVKYLPMTIFFTFAIKSDNDDLEFILDFKYLKIKFKVLNENNPPEPTIYLRQHSDGLIMELSTIDTEEGTIIDSKQYGYLKNSNNNTNNYYCSLKIETVDNNNNISFKFGISNNNFIEPKISLLKTLFISNLKLSYSIKKILPSNFQDSNLVMYEPSSNYVNEISNLYFDNNFITLQTYPTYNMRNLDANTTMIKTGDTYNQNLVSFLPFKFGFYLYKIDAVDEIFSGLTSEIFQESSYQHPWDINASNLHNGVMGLFISDTKVSFKVINFPNFWTVSNTNGQYFDNSPSSFHEIDLDINTFYCCIKILKDRYISIQTSNSYYFSNLEEVIVGRINGIGDKLYLINGIIGIGQSTFEINVNKTILLENDFISPTTSDISNTDLLLHNETTIIDSNLLYKLTDEGIHEYSVRVGQPPSSENYNNFVSHNIASKIPCELFFKLDFTNFPMLNGSNFILFVGEVDSTSGFQFNSGGEGLIINFYSPPISNIETNNMMMCEVSLFGQSSTVSLIHINPENSIYISVNLARNEENSQTDCHFNVAISQKGKFSNVYKLIGSMTINENMSISYPIKYNIDKEQNFTLEMYKPNLNSIIKLSTNRYSMLTNNQNTHNYYVPYEDEWENTDKWYFENGMDSTGCINNLPLPIDIQFRINLRERTRTAKEFVFGYYWGPKKIGEQYEPNTIVPSEQTSRRFGSVLEDTEMKAFICVMMEPNGVSHFYYFSGSNEPDDKKPYSVAVIGDYNWTPNFYKGTDIRVRITIDENLMIRGGAEPWPKIPTANYFIGYFPGGLPKAMHPFSGFRFEQGYLNNTWMYGSRFEVDLEMYEPEFGLYMNEISNFIENTNIDFEMTGDDEVKSLTQCLISDSNDIVSFLELSPETFIDIKKLVIYFTLEFEKNEDEGGRSVIIGFNSGGDNVNFISELRTGVGGRDLKKSDITVTPVNIFGSGNLYSNEFSNMDRYNYGFNSNDIYIKMFCSLELIKSSLGSNEYTYRWGVNDYGFIYPNLLKFQSIFPGFSFRMATSVENFNLPVKLIMYEPTIELFE